MHRILTIDDHEVVREGVKGLFASGIAEFGEARSGSEAINLILNNEWDVAILDISLAGRSGLDVLKEIKQLRPKLPVLMLSMHAEDQYAMRAFKAGASGYISKASSRDELKQAVLKVIKGGRYVSPSMAERMVFDLTSSINLMDVVSSADMSVYVAASAFTPTFFISSADTISNRSASV